MSESERETDIQTHTDEGEREKAREVDKKYVCVRRQQMLDVGH